MQSAIVRGGTRLAALHAPGHAVHRDDVIGHKKLSDTKKRDARAILNRVFCMVPVWLAAVSLRYRCCAAVMWEESGRGRGPRCRCRHRRRLVLLSRAAFAPPVVVVGRARRPRAAERCTCCGQSSRAQVPGLAIAQPVETCRRLTRPLEVELGARSVQLAQ